MRNSNPLEARVPAVIYPSGGIGDHLAALHALRALVQLFPGRLALICIDGAREVLFSEMNLRRVHEVKFFDSRGGGISMSRFPKTAPIPGWFWREEKARTNKVGGTRSARRAVAEEFWSFAPEEVAEEVGECGLLISLTPWHSTSADRLSEILSPAHSVGFSGTFDTPLVADFKRNLADICFGVVNSLAPSLKIEDFVATPAVPAEHWEAARSIISRTADGLRVIAVHVDTAHHKMWSPEGFRNVLDEFLARHTDFMALLVGCPVERWVSALCRDRVIHCFPVELQTSLALVAQSDLFLGIDSCMLHCADLHLVPGVGLFGPTDCSTWGFRFALHSHICGKGAMTSISENEVLDALESLI